MLNPLTGVLKRLSKVIGYGMHSFNTVDHSLAQPTHWRFLSDKPVAYHQAIAAAESYVSQLEEGAVSWLHVKPFDPTPGNPQYFRLMYDLLNMLQVLKIPPNGRILEVGSGPGWVTEILLMLGFSIDALEPSGDLIDIARERCAALTTHYRHRANPPVTFHKATLEDIEFEEDRFDAILFFDVLHHLVDEEAALVKCYRFLKPHACVGIVEGAWHPDFKALEQMCIDEMARFGTLENPFSTEYLDLLLRRVGFTEVQRYAAVNGFFSESQLAQQLKNFAAQPIIVSNNVTARKSSQGEVMYPLCTVLHLKTDVRLQLLSSGFDTEKNIATVRICLKNVGETLLSHRPQQSGYVTIALRQGRPATSQFLECKERHLLPSSLSPGDEIILNLVYTLPSANASNENWELDLVCENYYWFSSRGIDTCPIPLVVKF
jgi:ubiquinone/menaquinone biosynthesis C-methylase UbiE